MKKKLSDILDRTPGPILYIGVLVLLAVFAYSFPRLSHVLGFAFEYGLYVFLLFAVIIIVGTLVFKRNKQK